jgi:hypothetical protein
MTTNKVKETAKKFYVSNLPPNVSKDAIARVFSWFGPVLNITLFTSEVLHASGGYAEVEMLRKVHVRSTLIRLSDTKIDGYQISVTADKTYTEARNEIAALFAGTIDNNLKAADDLLSDVCQKFPESINILCSSKFFKRLKVAVEMGKELNTDTCSEIITASLAQRRLSGKRKKKKSSRSVPTILIPMGGQPPRRRR